LFIVSSTLAAWPCQAQQMHRCVGAGGRIQMSERPCEHTPPATPVLQHHGGPATQPPPAVPHATAPVEAVQPHHADLPSGACRDLSEALRTARARGIGPQGIADLQQEWQQRCQEEDAVAMQTYRARLQAEQRRRTDARRIAEADTARREQEAERCAELKRILAARRQRIDATSSPGEQADLARFEDSHKARCGSGR
jgi:hypothetical protein